MPNRAWRRYIIAFAALTVITVVSLQPVWGLTATGAVAARWVFAILWSLLAVTGYHRLVGGIGGRLHGEARIAVHFGLVVGVAIIVIVVLWLLGVSPSGLAVGGALTGVVLGLAAQSTLSNFFAGAVLMTLHPYLPGDAVSLRSSFWGIEYRGRVADLNFFYTVLEDESGKRIVIPNAGAASAAVTLLPDLRRPVAVPLPAATDLGEAERSLREAVPGAALSLNRLEAGALWVDVLLPDSAQAAALLTWMRQVTSAAG